MPRRCLGILAEADFPASVQSKSTLVLRDIDVFKRFKDIEVGFSIATDDDRMAALFEPGASPISARIEALRTLKEAGIRTYTFVGPLDGRADRILIDRMNYIDQFRAFFIRNNLEFATTDAFFADMTRRLVAELKKRRMNFEVVY